MAKLPTFKASRKGSIRRYDADVAKLAKEPDVRRAVAKLTFGHLDPKGKEGRVANAGTVRLDRQGNVSGGGANLQVQLNDPKKLGVAKNKGTTIGQVVVTADVFLAAHDCPEPNVRTALVRVVRAALLKSHASGGGAFFVAVK